MLEKQSKQLLNDKFNFNFRRWIFHLDKLRGIFYEPKALNYIDVYCVLWRSHPLFNTYCFSLP